MSGHKANLHPRRRMSIEEDAQEIIQKVRSTQDQLSRLGSIRGSSAPETKGKPTSLWWGLDQNPISAKEESWKDGVTELKESEKEDVGRFMIHPQSNFRVVWDSITLVLLLYFVFAVPLRLCFIDTQIKTSEDCMTYLEEGECDSMKGCFWKKSKETCEAEPQNVVMFWFDTLIDLFFLVDIVLNFRTCYFVSGERGTQRLETSKPKIAFRYLRSFFIFDLAGSIPVDAILAASRASSSDNNLMARLPKVLRVAKVARLLKLVRAARIGKIIDTLQETFNIKPGVFRVWKFAFVFITVAHLMACCLFASGTPKHQFVCTHSDPVRCPEDKVEVQASTTWITETYIMSNQLGEIAVENADLDVQYAMSIYWAFTIMTTVGFGDIQPATTIEVLVCILCMLVGASTFSYVVGNMADLADKAGGESAAHKAKMDQAMSFMQEHNVPKSLKMRVRRYYDFTHNNPQVDLSDNHFKDLSPILKNELLSSFRTSEMQNTTLFQALDPRERETFVSSLIGNLEPSTLCPGEVIFHQGEIGRHIVIIVEGEIDLLSHNKEPFATFKRGNHFGENILIPGQERCPFSARSRTFSNILLLSFKHLHAAFQDFPEAESRLRLSARLRWARIMKAYECHRILTKYKSKSSLVTGKLLIYLLARAHKDEVAEKLQMESEVIEFEDFNRKLLKHEQYMLRDINDNVTKDALGKQLAQSIAEICYGENQDDFDWSRDWVDSPDIPVITYKLGIEHKGCRLAEHKQEVSLGQKASAALNFEKLAIKEIDSEAENVKSGVDLEAVLSRIVHRLDLVEAQSHLFDQTIGLSEVHLFKPPAPAPVSQDGDQIKRTLSSNLKKGTSSRSLMPGESEDGVGRRRSSVLSNISRGLALGKVFRRSSSVSSKGRDQAEVQAESTGAQQASTVSPHGSDVSAAKTLGPISPAQITDTVFRVALNQDEEPNRAPRS